MKSLKRFVTRAALLTLFWLFLCAVRLDAATTFLPVPNRTDMVYDDDNHTLYATAGSSVVRYDTQSHQFLSPITLGNGQERLIGIDISPDRKTLAIADGQSTANNNWMYLLDTTTNAAT